jgi:fatty-acyl-CoA synthase
VNPAGAVLGLASRALRLAARAPELLCSVEVLRRAGLFDPLRGDEALRIATTVRVLGPVAGAVRFSAERDRRAVALADEVGELTFAQLDARSNALARAWLRSGLTHDSVIALLCRDHRGMVEAMAASAKIGARLLLLNTGFSGSALADVAARENVSALVYDQEFAGLLAGLPPSIERYLAWVDEPASAAGASTVEDSIAASSVREVPPPAEPGGLVLLTSGTTGTPKGATRSSPGPFGAAELLDRVPLRPAEATLLAAPLFHATGLSQFLLTLALGSTAVLQRAFDPRRSLAAIERHRCTALVLVPTMLARILDLGEDELARTDTSSLRIVFAAGSALSPDLGNRATRAFGEVLYNLYGSTEVAVASVATPRDWRRAPGTVGRAPVGARVKLFDDDGNEVRGRGRIGRVFVRSGLAFSGYSGGGSKEKIGDMLASGDVGHFDSHGLLHIDGRADDMVVSGGENVFPAEVENLLAGHEKIAEAAVVGVADEEFGQRLKAFVVPAAGCALDAEEVRGHVKANLARFKVPRDVEFVAELPRTATGKVRKNHLG